MPVPTPNTRGAEFWNSTMGHSWVAQQAVISDVFTSVTSVSLDAAAAKAGEHVIEDLFRRVPFERNRDDLGFVSRLNECVAQAFGVNLGAATNERDLYGSDENSHGPTFRPTMA